MASSATFQVYEDRSGGWRWRLVHDNVIAVGGQGYASKQRALSGIRSVKANAPDAAVEEHRVEEIADP